MTNIPGTQPQEGLNFNMLLEEYQKKWIDNLAKTLVEEYLKEDRMSIKLISKFVQKANECLPSGLSVGFAPANTVGLYKGQDMIATVGFELIEDNFDYALEIILDEAKKEAKMNIKDCTQTKNGTPVKIYEVYEDKVHGAFFNGTEWIICIWRLDGQNVCYDDKYLNLDLSDWKDEIPWDCLRPEIKCVARDKCGQWLGHDGEPIKDGQDGIWCSAGHEIYALDGVKMPQGPADWKEAIARRPE
jgi:hypothetical protein